MGCKEVLVLVDPIDWGMRKVVPGGRTKTSLGQVCMYMNDAED